MVYGCWGALDYDGDGLKQINENNDGVSPTKRRQSWYYCGNPARWTFGQLMNYGL